MTLPPPLGGANSALSNPLAEFEGPIREAGKIGKIRKEREGETEVKHPHPLEMNLWLRP